MRNTIDYDSPSLLTSEHMKDTKISVLIVSLAFAGLAANSGCSGSGLEQDPTAAESAPQDSPFDASEDIDLDEQDLATKASINGTNGSDVLYGTDSNDTIKGLRGNDDLFGLAGKDTLIGGKGNDDAVGGPDRDACSAERKRECE